MTLLRAYDTIYNLGTEGAVKAKIARTITVVAFGLSAVGCGAIRNAQQQAQQEALAAKFKEADTQAEAVMLECREKRLRKELKTIQASVECSNPRVYAIYRDAGDINLDLVNVYLAARLVGAENVDKGKITEGEYQLQLAELNSRIVDEKRRRAMANADMQMRQTQVAAQAQAAQAQSSAAMLQGLAALQSANRPRISNSLNCSTTGPYAMRTTNCF